MDGKVRDRRAVIGLGAALVGAGVGASAIAGTGRAATAGADPAAPWSPAFEEQDGWMDRPGTRHRLVFDTTVATAAESAMFYADTYYAANKSGYGLAPDTLGVILIFRHMSTPFGFNDAMWAKYGHAIAAQLKLEGEQAIRAVQGNPLLTAAPDPRPAKAAKPAKPSDDDDAPVTLAALAARGARFAVCGMATTGMAAQLAKKTGKDAKAVEAELKANLIPGAVIVPAGIVAVDRAQEHGYAFVYIPE